MSDINVQNISEQLRQKIQGFQSSFKSSEVGTVTTVGDGIAKVYGLDEAMAGELVTFDSGVFGLILNLEEDSVGVAIFGADELVIEGDKVKRTGEIARVGVSDSMLGRVVDGLGKPIDGKGDVVTDEFKTVEIKAPGVVARKSVNEPLQTGIKAIDSMIPIGRGQRELINRSKKNLQSVKDWIDARDWVDFLAKDPNTYSSTSICFKFTHPDFEKLDDENKKKLVKEVCSTIEKEKAGYDINAYKDAPAGIRIWGGATVESSDIDKLLPWIEWAFFETLERYK